MTDELTQDLPPDNEARITRPSITAVFELIQEVKRVVNNNGVRLNDLELQIKSGFSMLGNKIDALLVDTRNRLA